MIDDQDIWRAASLLVKRRGSDARLAAARRADELLAAGDVAGCAVWKRILAAVAELARTTPAEGRAGELSATQNWPMPRKLTEWDLRTIAEVTWEMAKSRGAGFDAYAQARTFVRAAQVDIDFRGRIEETARRIEARRGMSLPRKLLVPLAPLFRDLERDAEAVRSGWKAP